MPLRILTSIFLAVLSLAIAAQGLDKGTVTQASIALLADKNVRKEIGLTKEQDTMVQGEFKRINATLKEMFQKRPKDATEAKATQGKVRSMQMSMITRIQSRLTTPQAKRLRELGLQFYGPFSMLSDEIQKELSMTSAQVAKVKAAQKWMVDQTRALQSRRQSELKQIPQPKDRKDEKAVQAYFQKVNDLMKKYGPGDQKAVAGFKTQAEAKALAAITPAQKAKWNAMLGKKFKPA